jgi:hypothetical protein
MTDEGCRRDERLGPEEHDEAAFGRPTSPDPRTADPAPPVDR